MAREIIQALVGTVRGKKIAPLGRAFKPNIDDWRDPPSLTIVASFIGEDVQVDAYDPGSIELALPLMPDMTFYDAAYSATEGADVKAIILVWDAFCAFDLNRVKNTPKAPFIIDLRKI